MGNENNKYCETSLAYAGNVTSSLDFNQKMKVEKSIVSSKNNHRPS